MKIRSDFVTNSSSSSFIITKKYLSEKQIYKIENHYEYSQMKNWGDSFLREYDKWSIEIDEDTVKGYTFMDNFNMREFLHKIGVDLKHVQWEY